VTAGREGGTTGERGRLRTSRADREQAIDTLKAAFVQGRLTKDEFDLRVGRALASRTYADLAALTADLPDRVPDLPDRVAGVQLSDEDALEPGRMLSFKTAVRVGAVGATPAMASAAVLLVQSSAVPAVAGVILVALTGLSVAMLLAVLLMLMSWAVRRSEPGPGQEPPSGPTGLATERPAPDRSLPPAARDRWHIAEAVRAPRAPAGPAGQMVKRRLRAARSPSWASPLQVTRPASI
jgi:Domain of unknown function (DUF1707)